MNLREIIAEYHAIPEEEREAFKAKVLAQTKGQIWFPNPGPQTEAFFCEADELFYGGEAGGGKLSSINELVLTPTGWRRIGGLKIGDKICATDSTITEVIGVFPQGVKANYRVHFHDGTSCLAGLEHNWLGWWTGKPRKIGNVPTFGESSAAKWTTAEIIKGMERFALNEREKRFAIPVCQPVVFNLPGCPRRSLSGNYYVRRNINPYLLGLLLGDGSMSIKGVVSISSMDQEIEDWLLDQYPGDVGIYAKTNNLAKQYSFRGETRLALTQEIASGVLGLEGHKVETKFIPHVYLLGSIDERWALLQGLMDTDGWADIDGDCYYCTISKNLADDVAHLARSLGAIVTTTEKLPTYSHKGKKLDGQRAYALRIKVSDSTQLFRLSRKKERAGRIPQGMAKYVERIEYSHDEESVCIAVRHPNSLYITRDFIVTHNTDLLLGTALTNHARSLILRRLNGEVSGLIDRMEEMVGPKNLKRNPPAHYRTRDQIVMFSGCQFLQDREKHQGVPKDFIAYDEITRFLEAQFRFINAWNRSTRPGQRVRSIATGNPPTTAEGMWVIKYWGPWLDPAHPNPALPGELRWFTTIDDQDVEVDGPGPVMIDGKPYLAKDGKPVMPRSRTFIPAELADNPDLAETNYGATLDALPAELKASLRQGDFTTNMEDTPFQVFPAAWIEAAQNRWNPTGENFPMTVLAVDIAQGGEDKTTRAARHGNWFARVKTSPGKETPDGPTVAAIIVNERRNGCEITIDMGGGYGGSTNDHLKSNGITPTLYNGAGSADGRRDRTGTLKFKNIRAAAHWHLREGLDPANGATMALPPDPELKAQMVSIRYKVTTGGIQVEDKKEIKARIGHSPDKSDAVVMCNFATGMTNRSGSANHSLQTQANVSGRNPRRR